MFRSLLRCAVLALLAVPLASLGGGPAGAATYDVTDPTDDGTLAGTLRWAVEQANADAAPAVIDIAPGLDFDLTCAGGGALAFDNATGQPLTINANGATVRQTCGGEAVVTADDDLTVNDATITGGAAGGIVGQGDVTVDGVVIEENTGGAGIIAFTGRVIVRTSLVRGNTGGIGGGVAGVFVEIEDSTITGNTGSNGAGVWSDQTATITNSTITGNTATVSGGGVLTTNSHATFVYTTIVDNTAPAGANLSMLTAGNLTSFATVFAAPGGGPNCTLNPAAVTVSQGSNFTSDASCGLEVGAGDPLLGALGDNGGPTPTRLPAASSPLVDAADCGGSPIADDQRAITRPHGDACDIGAVEIVPPPPDPTTTTTVVSEGSGSETDSGARATLPATGGSPVLVVAGVALCAAGAALLLRVRTRFPERGSHP